MSREPPSWTPVAAALDEAFAAGRSIDVWLRDDDAVAVTPALDRLGTLCGVHGMPILLAVIPQPAEDALAGWIAARPTVSPCQHGFAHRNHAPPGARAIELGGRPVDVVLEELGTGRQRLRALFGHRLADVLVPPWNRIDPVLLPWLGALGYSALSTFGAAPVDEDGPPRRNTHLDIINWRQGRRGRDLADLAAKLVPLIGAARNDGYAIGLLTHHLAHDEQAWAVLDDILGRLHAHPAVRFVAP